MSAPTVFTGFEGVLENNAQATILISTQTSSTIPCSGFTFCGVIIPIGFTGTAITFLASVDGATFFPVYSTASGTALSYTVAAGHYCAVDPKDFYGINYLQIKSGSSEVAARTLIAALKGF